MEYIFSIIAERQAEMAELPQNVRTWVMFMRVWFFSGLIFILWWKPARWVVLTMIATAIAILASKALIPDFNTIRAGTLIQLMLWVPLLWYLVNRISSHVLAPWKNSKIIYKLFAAWLGVATILVLISTMLNIYNVISWVI